MRLLSVNNISNLFNELSDNALISFSGFARAQQEIHFCEVHTDRLRDESLKELHHEVKRDALVLRCAS
jgi:galactokinase/mevalonate kinase-like predicted kinase